MSKIKTTFILSLLLITINHANGFWLVNFGTAKTLSKSKIGFGAGIGGKMVFLGSPTLKSAIFTIPFVGFRYGLSNRFDIGLRLAPLPLPFSSVAPGFGANIDVKYCFTKNKKLDVAMVLGISGAHVLIEENTRYAYSPNAALLGTYSINESTFLTLMLRYVNMGIPTAPEGKAKNFANIAGGTLGLKKNIRSNVSVLPEVGFYYFDGKIKNVNKRGPGFIYGLMLATSF